MKPRNLPEQLLKIEQHAQDFGFSQIGVSDVDLHHAEAGLLAWLEAGFHGSMDYMAAHTLLCMLGGMLGVIFGRPMARLIASICLPARVRSLLAYLWLVDGKQPKLTSPQNPERK